METIGIPPDKHETDENEEGKPLSAGKSSEVSAKLLQKAHLYVIQNTDEIVPYIEQKQVLKIENLGKRIAFLENEHCKSFAKCLRKEVERELAISKRKCIRNIIVVNLNSSSDNNNSDSYSTSQISTSEEIDYDSPEPPKSLLKWYHYLSDEYKNNGRFWGSKSGCNEKIIKISSDSLEDRKGASKATAPIFYGPSTQGLLDAYGYNTIEEYLSWNYFPSTDNESTDMETTNKRNTDKDCIVDSNSAMSKGNQKLMQIRQRGKERCHVEADHALAFDQSFLGSLTCLHIAFIACICTLHLYIAFAACICSLHLQLAFAACICSLHLQLAFASKHLHIAFADCICTLHLYIAFAACIIALAHCICRLKKCITLTNMLLWQDGNPLDFRKGGPGFDSHWGRSFWDVPLRGNMSWGWRKMLQRRPIIRDFIWCKLGDGARTLLWFDRWCDAGPIAKYVSTRDMFCSGLSLTSKVKDVLHNGVWNWPTDLLDKYPILNEYFVLAILESLDCLKWYKGNGIFKAFSVHQVWSSIRPRDVKVPWFDMVWFASDSHEHLFFECSFAHDIWTHMKGLGGLDLVAPDIYAIINHIGAKAKRRTTPIVITKLVVAGSAYFIWQEHNWRLFKNTKRSLIQVIITSAVRLKLLSCHFKRSKEGVKYARI
ncbi:hypothetical protein Tco_0820929 [Tanacetum coccineum]|uniref:Reverse transcriptase zinc-binding domain-containing protein n=1 Tax=Tanacetum coccineum TaxID=301880 RepID=A0ABQ5AAW2_9ASTR